MSTTGLIMEDASPVTQEQAVLMDAPVMEGSIAILKDELPIGSFVMLTPDAVHSLVEHHVQVFMQRGFASQSQFTDMEYADAGAEFADDFFTLSSMAKVLVKFTPFTEDQIALLKDGHVIFSTQFPSQLNVLQIEKLNSKKITALAMNLIKDAEGMYVTDKILSETWSATAVNIALSGFLLPLVEALAVEPKIKFLLQKNPALMQSAYCYNGYLCNKEIAELLGQSCNDISSLCWDMN